jgi:cysteinyl-tRNA synthetase
MALLLLFLSSHYRSQLNFTWDALRGQQHAWRRLQQRVWELVEELGGVGSEVVEELVEGAGASLGERAAGYQEEFFGALREDLKTPQAMAVFWEMVQSDELSAREQLDVILQADRVLGLGLRELVQDEEALAEVAQLAEGLPLEQLPEEARELAAQRLTARAEKDFERADELREELAAAGWRVEDTGDGQRFFQK